MALIKCPECGKEISTNANACPHCGTAIRICPECGAVYTNTQPTCTNCGYVFDKTSAPPMDAEKATGGAIQNQWLARASADKKIAMTLKYAGKALDVLDIVIYLIGVLLFILWSKKDPVERVFEVDSTLSNIKICIAFGCIVYIISAVRDYASERIMQIRFSNWLTVSNIDAKEYLKMHCNDLGGEKEQEAFTLVAYGEYLKGNQTEKNYFFKTLIIKIIIAVTAAVLAGVSITENIKIAMEFVCLDQSVDYSKLNYVLIAFAVVTLLASFIAGCFMTSVQDKRMNKWVEGLTYTRTEKNTQNTDTQNN